MTWVKNGSPLLDDQSQWQAIIITTLIFTMSMILVVALRFWIRRRILHIEDWLTFGTMLFSSTYSASVILQTRYGLGLPVALQPPQDWHHYMSINYASRPFYLLGLAGFKLALCTSYLRMTQGSTGRTYRRIIVAVAYFSTFSHIIFVLLYLCQCVPISGMFDRDAVTDGQCIRFAPLNYSISVVVILCDVTIFLLPMPLIYRLHLERSIKIGLAIAFALGLLTTVLSIMRATQIHRIAYGDGDDTYFVIRSALELNIGIITSCLPVLRPVLRLIPRKLISLLRLPTTNNNSSASHSNGAIELPGDYPPTQSSYAGSTIRTWLSRNSMGKSEVFYTTTTPIPNNNNIPNNKEMNPTDGDYSPSLPSRNASTMSKPPLAASRPNWADHRRSATARSILSQAGTTQSLLSTTTTTTTTNEGMTQSLISGGGRQRWEHPDGSGRWEGFGGVIRTVELEVSSEASSLAPAPMTVTRWGELERALTRKDEWEVPPVSVPLGAGERG